MLGARTLVMVLEGVLIAALLFLAAPAVAHADLMGGEPEPNTEVEKAPKQLVAEFSEPLEDTYTSIEVVDANGSDHVDSFAIGEDRRVLSADLAPLEDGVYTITWRALSSADGHTTSGSYLLGVNASLAAEDEPASGPTGDGANAQGTQVGEGGPGEALLRGLGFAGASLAAGIPLFWLVAGGIQLPARVHRRWSALAIAGAGLATLASLGLILALAFRIQAPFEMALSTTPGENLGLRAAAFATAGGLLFAGWRGRASEHGAALTAAGSLAALCGLLFTSLGSHAAAGGVDNGLAIVVDWTHQAAVAFWVSGVVALLVAGRASTREASAAKLVRRFSPLAVASVLAIVLTGLLASVDRLTSPSDLIASLYGFALSTKILLLIPILALGAYHRYVLLPQLETPGHEDRDVSLLRRSAALEVGLMLVVLLAAGFLATTSPPTPVEEQAPFASFDEAMAAQRPSPYEPDVVASDLVSLNEAQAANLTLTLLVPDRIDELDQGDQLVWLLLADENGERATPVTDAEVEIQAWMPEHGHGTQPESDPVHVHEGMYEGQTHWLMPGAWELRFNVSLPEGDVLRYSIALYVDQEADPLSQREAFHAFSEDGFDVEVFLSPQPVRIGVQNFTVKVTPQERVHPENADVVVNLEAPSSGGGEGQGLDLERWREDAWTQEDAIFTETGNWSALVAFQGRSTYFQDSFDVEVEGR